MPIIAIPDFILTLTKSVNYDVRISRDGRWYDQKYTPNVVSFVADCIDVYLESHPNCTGFTVKDIWHSDYARENVMSSFGKPDPLNESAKREYDKFFGQPINLLRYSGVLSFHLKRGVRVYNVKHIDVLKYVATRERNAADFLFAYTEKAISDSGLKPMFDIFFNRQDSETYQWLKDEFETFEHSYTGIKGHLECGRIFTKVLNNLAYYKSKRGSADGRISNEPISFADLMYKADNFRDLYSNKPRGMTRAEYQESFQRSQDENKLISNYSNYQISKAKRYVRDYNQRYNDNKSELREHDSDTSSASYIHHIFPKSQYPEIASFLENLIALTPNQHWNEAHLARNTSRIDREYQHLLLLCKCETIRIDYVERRGRYDFSKLLIVLDTAFDTDEFSKIDYLDFDTLIKKIDLFYTDYSDYF